MSLTWSEPCDEIVKALWQATFSIVDPKKSVDNPFLKSKYADYAAVVDSAWLPLRDHSLLLMQGPGISDDGKVVYVTTRLTHVPTGQWVETTAGTPLAKADPQGTGSAITYLRRYGLQTLLGIIPEDDDGEGVKRPAAAPERPIPPMQRDVPMARPAMRPARTASGNRPGPGLTPISATTTGGERMTPSQHGMIMAICSQRSMEAEDRHKLFQHLTGKETSSELNKKDASVIIDYLKKLEESERAEEDALLEYNDEYR